jgi:AraC-like DNA-binding protein
VIGSPSVYGSAAHDDHLPGELRSRSNAALGLTEMQGPLPDTLGKKVGKPVSSERTRATEARLLKREAWLTAMLEPTVALRFTMFGFCTQPTSWEGFVDRRVPEHLVWAVTAGELSAKIAGRSWLLRPGGFCLLPPETLHTFVHGEPRQPLVVHLFRFELLRGNVLLHLAHTPPVLEAAPSPREHLEPLHDYRQAADEEAAIRIKARLVLLLSSAFRTLDSSSLVGGMLSYDQRRRLYKMLAEWRGERVRPNDRADRLGLSAEYFTRPFSRTFRIAPRRWLIEQRIRDAASVLVDSTLTISQVARELGNQDVYEFSRQFKQIWEGARTRTGAANIRPCSGAKWPAKRPLMRLSWQHLGLEPRSRCLSARRPPAIRQSGRRTPSKDSLRQNYRHGPDRPRFHDPPKYSQLMPLHPCRAEEGYDDPGPIPSCPRWRE